MSNANNQNSILENTKYLIETYKKLLETAVNKNKECLNVNYELRILDNGTLKTMLRKTKDEISLTLSGITSNGETPKKHKDLSKGLFSSPNILRVVFIFLTLISLGAFVWCSIDGKEPFFSNFSLILFFFFSFCSYISNQKYKSIRLMSDSFTMIILKSSKIEKDIDELLNDETVAPKTEIINLYERAEAVKNDLLKTIKLYNTNNENNLERDSNNYTLYFAGIIGGIIGLIFGYFINHYLSKISEKYTFDHLELSIPIGLLLGVAIGVMIWSLRGSHELEKVTSKHQLASSKILQQIHNLDDNTPEEIKEQLWSMYKDINIKYANQYKNISKD